MLQLDELLRRDNGVVIGYLCVVDKGRFLRPGLLGQTGSQLSVGAGAAGCQAILYGIRHIAAQISGICSRIGEYLVVLVEPLHNV